MRAFLILAGDELVTGEKADRNGPFLAELLSASGIEVREIRVVGDRLVEICDAIRQGLAVADAVVITGGLGPTQDDRTRQAVAAALDLELRVDPSSLAAIEERARTFGRAPGEGDRSQALVPAGARILANRGGIAPGFVVEAGGSLIAALPGVPSEMRAMAEEELLPLLVARAAGGPVSQKRVLQVFGPTESEIAARIADLTREERGVRVGDTVRDGIITVIVRGRGDDRAALERALEHRAAAIRERLGDAVFSDGESLEEVVGRLLIDRRRTIATAESCTGGLLASMLTRVPGISASFRMGLVAYANEAKTELLGIPASTLEAHGAVSEPVARGMAEGVARRSGADIGIGITGIAGPGGGTAEKPVGLVYVALSRRSESAVRRLQLRGDRIAIQRRAALTALDWCRLSLLREGA